MKVDISYIIPVFNAENHLKECLQSIVIASKELDYEIIVVDDCSPGPCKNLIHDFGNENVKYIRHEQNKSCFQARLSGIKSARGKYIFSIDPDDLLLDVKMQELIKYANAKSTDIIQLPVAHGSNPTDQKQVSYSSPLALNTNKEIWDAFVNHKHEIHWNFCGKLFLSKFLKKTLESYADDGFYLNMCEDFCLTVPCYSNASSFHIVCNLGKYFYRESNSSLTHVRLKDSALALRTINEYKLARNKTLDYLSSTETNTFRSRQLDALFSSNLSFLVPKLEDLIKIDHSIFTALQEAFNREDFANFFVNSPYFLPKKIATNLVNTQKNDSNIKSLIILNDLCNETILAYLRLLQNTNKNNIKVISISSPKDNIHFFNFGKYIERITKNELAKFLKDFTPEIVYSIGYSSDIALSNSMFLKLLGYPVIYVEIGGLFGTNDWATLISKKIKFFRLFDSVVVNDSLSLKIYESAKIIHLKLFDEQFKSLNLTPQNKQDSILVIADTISSADMICVLDLVHALKESMSPFVYIVGTVEKKNQLLSLIKNAGLDKQIIFTEWLENGINLLKTARVVLNFQNDNNCVQLQNLSKQLNSILLSVNKYDEFDQFVSDVRKILKGDTGASDIANRLTTSPSILEQLTQHLEQLDSTNVRQTLTEDEIRMISRYKRVQRFANRVLPINSIGRKVVRYLAKGVYQYLK